MNRFAEFKKGCASLVLAALAACALAGEQQFIHCSDLSYVNEMLDAGVEYRVNGIVTDPYKIFHDIGNQVVRVRLWHNPAWSGGYSTFEDVARTIRASKAAGMQVMLNFHYSDSWTDPGKQIVPAAWAEHVDDTGRLGDLMYQYTYDTLRKLDGMGLMPEFVQIGNENDSGIMNAKPWSKDFIMDWPRHVALFNRGIQAARDAGKLSAIQPKIIVHVAMSHGLEYWFRHAFEAGLADIDYIGVSYYTAWTTTSVAELGRMVNRWRHLFQTEVFIAEVAYPWTLLWDDDAMNMIGAQALQRGYPASIRGQREFLINLTQVLISNGCSGMSYWEPAWVSSDRPTQWGIGSHWENVTLFDFRKGKNELHAGSEYMTFNYRYPTPVEFRAAVSDESIQKLYLWGDFIGGEDFAVELVRDGSGRFSYKTSIQPGTDVAFQVYKQSPIIDGKLSAAARKDLRTVRIGDDRRIVEVLLD